MLRQEGHNDLRLSARWRTNALELPIYCGWRVTRWHEGAGWALDLHAAAGFAGRYFGVEVGYETLGRVRMDGMSDGAGSLWFAGRMSARLEGPGVSVSGLLRAPAGTRWVSQLRVGLTSGSGGLIQTREKYTGTSFGRVAVMCCHTVLWGDCDPPSWPRSPPTLGLRFDRAPGRGELREGTSAPLRAGDKGRDWATLNSDNESLERRDSDVLQWIARFGLLRALERVDSTHEAGRSADARS